VNHSPKGITPHKDKMVTNEKGFQRKQVPYRRVIQHLIPVTSQTGLRCSCKTVYNDRANLWRHH